MTLYKGLETSYVAIAIVVDPPNIHYQLHAHVPI